MVTPPIKEIMNTARKPPGNRPSRETRRTGKRQASQDSPATGKDLSESIDSLKGDPDAAEALRSPRTGLGKLRDRRRDFPSAPSLGRLFQGDGTRLHAWIGGWRYRGQRIIRGNLASPSDALGSAVRTNLRTTRGCRRGGQPRTMPGSE